MSRNHETGYKRFISDKEILLIIAHSNQPYKLIFLIMKYMGLRIGEVLPLKYEQIIGDYEYIRLTLEKSRGKVIDRLISRKLKYHLKAYVEENKSKTTNGYLFQPNPKSNSKNNHVIYSSVSWYLWKLRIRLGLNDVYYRCNRKFHRISPHTFRHYFISTLYAKTNDPVLCKEVIGHKKIETTMIYISLSMLREKEKAAVNLI